MELMQFGEPVKSLDAATPSSGLNGTAYAVPDNNSGFAWTQAFATDPTGSVDVALQISNDNNIWTDLDSSSSLTGESRYVAGTGRFVRARLETVTAGVEITVTISLVRGG